MRKREITGVSGSEDSAQAVGPQGRACTPAKIYMKTSLTRIYFKGVLNFIVQPWTFLCLGIGLSHKTGSLFIMPAAILAAFGSLMLMIIPACEDAILLSAYKKKSTLPSATALPEKKEDFFIFITCSPLVLILFGVSLEQALLYLLLLCAFSYTLIWIVKTLQIILSKKLDVLYLESIKKYDANL